MQLYGASTGETLVCLTLTDAISIFGRGLKFDSTTPAGTLGVLVGGDGGLYFLPLSYRSFPIVVKEAAR